MALDMTTTSFSKILSLLCPTEIGMPLLTRVSVVLDEFKSEPETIYPRSFNIDAIPDIPLPPIPIK